MSANNGVIRIGRKGLKRFAFGEDGKPFTVDVVEAVQAWLIIDDEFRPIEEDKDGLRMIPLSEMPRYHQAAVEFACELSSEEKVSKAEALDFIARLRESYDELAVFFRPKLLEKRDSPDTSEPASRFSVEEEPL